MKYILLSAIVCIVSVSCTSPKPAHPHVLIITNAGDIEAEIYTDKAPKTANAFLRNVDKNYYKNSSFYRILNNDNQPSNAPKSNLIQGGIWKTNYAQTLSVPGIAHESTKQTGIRHQNGTLSMARMEPGTAGTEFFICVGDQPGFDYGGVNNPDGQGYAAFGKVVKGMNVVNTIYNRPENNQAFTPQVYIFNIKRL